MTSRPRAIRRIRLGILLVLEAALLGALFMPIFMHTQRERRALSAWTRDQSKENEAALQAALAEIQQTRWVIRAVLLFAFGLNTFAIVRACGNKQREPASASR